jgi:hypothetical protein
MWGSNPTPPDSQSDMLTSYNNKAICDPLGGIEPRVLTFKESHNEPLYDRGIFIHYEFLCFLKTSLLIQTFDKLFVFRI